MCTSFVNKIVIVEFIWCWEKNSESFSKFSKFSCWQFYFKIIVIDIFFSWFERITFVDFSINCVNVSTNRLCQFFCIEYIKCVNANSMNDDNVDEKLSLWTKWIILKKFWNRFSSTMQNWRIEYSKKFRKKSQIKFFCLSSFASWFYQSLFIYSMSCIYQNKRDFKTSTNNVVMTSKYNFHKFVNI